MTIILDKAIADYSRAIKLAPNNAIGYLGRAKVMIEKVRFEEHAYEQVLADITKAIELDQRSAPLGYALLAWAKFEQGNEEEGLLDAQHAVELSPNLASAFEARGHMYQSLNRGEEAIRDLRKALELDPKLYRSRELLERLTAIAAPSINGVCGTCYPGHWF